MPGGSNCGGGGGVKICCALKGAAGLAQAPVAHAMDHGAGGVRPCRRLSVPDVRGQRLTYLLGGLEIVRPNQLS